MLTVRGKKKYFRGHLESRRGGEPPPGEGAGGGV